MGCSSSVSTSALPETTSNKKTKASISFDSGTQPKETGLELPSEVDVRSVGHFNNTTNANSWNVQENTESLSTASNLGETRDNITGHDLNGAYQFVRGPVSVTAFIDEEKEIVAEAEISYAEFPTHVNLREANEKYARKRKSIPRTPDGLLRPFPSYRRKTDIFDKEKFAELDKYADETPHDMMRRSVEDVVKYLNRKCTTDLEKARVYFRWLATRDIANLIPANPAEDDENAVLKTLLEVRDSVSGGRSSDHTDLYAEMCRKGGLQVEIIKGNVRTAAKLDMKIGMDDHVNRWLAVVIDNEWRLVDIRFAVIKATGGGPGDWELIDDNGKGYRHVYSAPVGITYDFDEYYFLTDPEHFIYDHRPFQDEWQLLTRQVTITEFQEMAFLRHAFFENDLGIGNEAKYLLEASDGEVELDINLPEGQKRRFMYQLWRSTKSGPLQSFKGFELSQFVLLQQKNNRLHCKVVFPVSGDYKIDLFVRRKEQELETGTYALSCNYILHCKEAKEEWNALPRNSRNEWGFSHEMCDLGLVPITHHDAIIETDDGNLELKFKCTKDPVDCLVLLKGIKQSDTELERCVIFRQNENRELVICVKLPERGLYALKLYGKWRGTEGNCPHLATYLIASTTAAVNKQPFPKISNQMSGETTQNISLKLQAKSHKESVIIVKESSELLLQFETPITVDVSTHFYLWSHESKEDYADYSFVTKRQHDVDFHLRFVETGIYTFEIFAKPKDDEGTYPHVYTYIIFALLSNPEWAPFPKTYYHWGHGCEVEGLMDGQVEAGQQKNIKILAPSAADVVVITEEKEWTHLKKMEDDKWEGDVNTGKAGKLEVAANYGGGKTFSTLLECEVKTAAELQAEKKRRLQKIKKVQQGIENEKKQEEEKRKRLQQQFEETRQELKEAISQRDPKKLHKAIIKVEKNNYTKRLEQEYNEAKELKKSLDKIARLRKLVLNIDQKVMAVIRNYPKPPPLVHATMRATLLLLGNELNETREWKKCQALCNTIELNKSFRAFDVTTVSAGNAKKARNILDPMRLEDINDTSDVAAKFYVWTLGMTEEVMQLHKK